MYDWKFVRLQSFHYYVPYNQWVFVLLQDSSLTNLQSLFEPPLEKYFFFVIALLSIEQLASNKTRLHQSKSKTMWKYWSSPGSWGRILASYSAWGMLGVTAFATDQWIWKQFCFNIYAFKKTRCSSNTVVSRGNFYHVLLAEEHMLKNYL